MVLSERAKSMADFALEQMKSYGLTDWTFTFNKQKRTLGLCIYRRKQIQLSIYYVENNKQEQILDTILHEIAHALAWLQHGETGHGSHWRRIAEQIGARPERCCTSTDVVMPEPVKKTVYIASCPSCLKQHTRYRMNHRAGYYYCNTCGPERGRLNFEKIDSTLKAC